MRKCERLVGVRMPTEGDPGPELMPSNVYNEKLRMLVDHFFKGAMKAEFKDVFFEVQMCGDDFIWDFVVLPSVLEIKSGNDGAQERAIMRDNFLSGRTQGIWYFCRRRHVSTWYQ